jgi:hypothetical protein
LYKNIGCKYNKKGTGTVKTVLPTQITEKSLKWFKSLDIVLKIPRTFFKRNPKFAIFGEKSAKLAPLI